MAERARRSLPYGHLGRAVFSLHDEKVEEEEEGGEWRFERSLTAPLSIYPLGSPRSVCSPRRQQRLKPEQPRKEPQGNRHRQQIRDLVAHIPELQPAATLLPDLLQVSEAVQTATENHDASRGCLITATNIRSELQHKSIRIAALPSGATQSNLRLIQVQKQRRGWPDNKKRWINVPTLFGEEAVWDCLDGPIQQVLFADPVDRGEPLLGVRLLTKTLIFRPKHGRSLENIEAASSIHPNLLRSIDIALTGNCAHSDVAFNPWFSQQVGFVDQTGKWTIMEFQSQKLSRVARSWSASVKSTSPSDGWARIAWILNLETVAVCTRQSLALYQISGDSATLLSTITPEIENGAQWILDFARLPGHPDTCVLLTSTQLLMYQIASTSVRRTKVHTKCTIEHFRNPEDTTMRLSMWLNHEDIFVLLYAGRGAIKTLYRFAFTNENQLHLPEPTELRLFHDDAGAHIADIQVSSAPTTDNGSPSHPRRLDTNQHFVATIMFSNGSIIEQVLCCSYDHQSTQGATTWESKLGATGVRSEHTKFIDDTETTDDNIVTSAASRRARLIVSRKEPEDRTVELSRVAQAFSAPSPRMLTLEHALKGVVNAFDAEENTILPMRTLGSLILNELDILNIETLAETLNCIESLLSPDDSRRLRDGSPNESRKLQVVYTVTPPVLDLGAELNDGSLTSVYKRVVTNWLGPLSDVPGRVRLAKDVQARHVATDLVLGHILVRVKESEASTYAPVDSLGTQSTWDLPVRSSVFDAPEPSSSAIRASQYLALPTPSPTATPSVATMSTGMSSLAAPEIYRLSRYAPITRPSPLVLARSMRKILSHWIEGESPDHYDWRTASKDLEREEDDKEAEGMTEKERKRLHRKAERHMRRQRKQAEVSQAQQMASSQAPEIMAASQPNPFTTESQPAHPSSQRSIPRRADPASQVVPGRFGGQPPPKKKRKSGF